REDAAQEDPTDNLRFPHDSKHAASLKIVALASFRHCSLAGQDCTAERLWFPERFFSFARPGEGEVGSNCVIGAGNPGKQKTTPPAAKRELGFSHHEMLDMASRYCYHGLGGKEYW
ncbi:MAG: hypothetical protein O2931_04005, partial [Planctomycetota bacterium]|nr:hypothetical protein [Planctomycetota bacterium]